MADKKIKPKDIEKARKIAKEMSDKIEEELHTSIKNLLILNKKAKIGIIVGIALARRYIAKNKIKIKKCELAIKKDPKQAQLYQAKAADLKAKNILLTKIGNGFASIEPELNKEIGWLTNEAGALHIKKMSVVKNAIKEESNSLIKQGDILTNIFKLIKTLKVKKAVLKKPEQVKTVQTQKQTKAAKK